jgi:5-methylcytosine-specific restriction endonuclease McrA
MPPITSVEQLSDHDLLDETQRLVRDERRVTAQLLALLAELEVRRLYLGQSCSSLFAYCTQVLHLSEHAAYHRIEAARAARQFPVILQMVADGALTLTNIALLRPRLTRDNHIGLLEAARHKSKHQVQCQIAALAPRPAERTLLRKMPTPVRLELSADVSASDEPHAPAPTFSAPRPTVAPLAPDRYLLKVTVSAATHARLRRAQDLMRHTIPNGDPAAIIDRALTLLVEQLERTKMAATTRPRRATGPPSTTHSRRLPAAVRRAVWNRDDGRCAFVGTNGRCAETGFLEFHHVRPYGDGGRTTVENLQLRCRAHNEHEAELYFGPEIAGVYR